MVKILPLLVLGLAAGGLSGLIGIGGGVIIVPALIFIFGFSQQTAQGTTLALMVPPIGILGAWAYYRQGYVDVRTACIICLGFVIGSLLGAKFAVNVPAKLLEKIFGAALFAISLKMIFAK